MITPKNHHNLAILAFKCKKISKRANTFLIYEKFVRFQNYLGNPEILENICFRDILKTQTLISN